MNHLYDVAVIGAGPAGSYVASLLAAAGHDVLVLDRRRTEDLAPLCTGVVGLPYVEMLELENDVILAQAMSASVHSPFGRRLRVTSSRVQACVLDRVLLEQRLRQRAVASGAEMHEGITVSQIEREGGRHLMRGLREGRREVFSARALILASGVGPALAGQAGLGVPRSYLVGAHMEMVMDGVIETEVHALADIAPGAFAWLVPIGSQRVRVGVLAARSAAQLTERFLDRPAVRKRVRSRLTPLMQRPIPVAASTRTYADGAVSIGDAAGQVKPTTGGGLYFGAIAARAAAGVTGEALVKNDLCSGALAAYQRQWRSAFGRELRNGALARAIYNHLSPQRVDGIMHWADRTALSSKLLDSGSFSFDRHSGMLLFGLLRCLPGLLPGHHARLSEEDV